MYYRHIYEHTGCNSKKKKKFKGPSCKINVCLVMGLGTINKNYLHVLHF